MVATYSTYGIICAIISMFIFVGQNIYGKKVFTYKSNPTDIDNLRNYDSQKADSPLPVYADKKEYKEEYRDDEPVTYDKLTLMIYISLVGFCMSFGWFIMLELPLIWGYICLLYTSRCV